MSASLRWRDPLRQQTSRAPRHGRLRNSSLPGDQSVGSTLPRGRSSRLPGVWRSTTSPGPTIGATTTAALRTGRGPSRHGGKPMMQRSRQPASRTGRSPVLDFLVVQGHLLSETAAKVVRRPPAPSFAERDGTYTNTERWVQFSAEGRSWSGPAGLVDHLPWEAASSGDPMDDGLDRRYHEGDHLLKRLLHGERPGSRVETFYGLHVPERKEASWYG